MTSTLRATLGFEPEIIREGEEGSPRVWQCNSRQLASERLVDAETQSSADHHRAQRDPHAYRSSIYSPGSEFALCHAESQLMSAVVGILAESLTDGIKGFYKLRKAYITLDGLLEAEKRYMQGKNGGSIHSSRRTSMESLRSTGSARSTTRMPGGFDDEPSRSTLSPKKNALEPEAKPPLDTDRILDDNASDEFYDADEGYEGHRTPRTGIGEIDMNGTTEKMTSMSMDSPDTPNTRTLPSQLVRQTTQHMLDHSPGSDVIANPIDIFIHSGSNLCFGFLLLLLSMIPPAFGKLLVIIGFRGDRDRGLSMLWQATKFSNINGAMAGLILLGYYNGIVGFCDILPDTSHGFEKDVLGGYPKERCEALLSEMRTRYPKSRLWLLEEARTQAANRRLETAIDLLSGDIKSPLKQVEALATFEKALNAMYLHRYALCADSFLTCVSLNNWSHALYYYIAGSAHVELYRRLKLSDPTSAQTHAQRATDLLKKVVKHAGKKKFMARQLPFDVFVVRKISKWELRAKEWNVPFVDAVGVSPVEEMIYLWNGYKRMPPAQLEDSLACLSWSEDASQNPLWQREGLDERAVLAVLRAAILRCLGRYDEAKGILMRDVIAHDKALFKGHLRDDWTAPTARYEMGVLLWVQGRGEGESVRECGEWVDRVARWEGYSMDARIGLKVATAQDTLRKWGERRGGGVGAGV